MPYLPYVIYEQDEEAAKEAGEQEVDFSKFMDFVLDEEEKKKKKEECDAEEHPWKKFDDSITDTPSNKITWS